MTEGLGSILAGVSDGDISGMASVIENERVNPYARSVAMRGLLTLVTCGNRSREEIVAYFHHLFQKLNRTPTEVWDASACRCTDLWPGELMDDLRRAWEEELIPPGMINQRKLLAVYERE